MMTDGAIARVEHDLLRRQWPVYRDDAVADVLAEPFAMAFGDGLPIIPPTYRRIEAMLASVQAQDAPDRSIGSMPPMEGDLTPAAIAYCAVTAGCRPSEMPVLMAAAQAVLHKPFNLLGVQSTTGATAVALMVHGPIVADLAMNAGANCLGPGNRSNACIGRALQFILRGVGGAFPGATDMATMGQPGKYAFCFAEGQHAALPALHARRGASNASAVTVMAVSGTLEVLPADQGEGAEPILQPLIDAVRLGQYASGKGRMARFAEQLLLVPPEILDWMDQVGLSWERAQRLIADRAGLAECPVHLVCTGGIGLKSTYLQPWGGRSLSVTYGI